MIKTGKEHIESLNDGRTVYIGNEKVENITDHPAFRNAARTVATLYDVKHDPEFKDVLSFEEHGERYSMWFLKARNREDLRKRSLAHKKIADVSSGLFGRSPDHVASFVTGMSTNPSVFDSDAYKFGDNLLAYYEYFNNFVGF